jgi:heat shock protein HspQ
MMINSNVSFGSSEIIAPPVAHAHFSIGDVVRHRIFDFRGVIYDVDPVFANTEEWYDAIPEEVKPRKDQPFYHLLAENGESSYVAYVSQQNLLADDEGGPSITLRFRASSRASRAAAISSAGSIGTEPNRRLWR